MGEKAYIDSYSGEKYVYESYSDDELAAMAQEGDMNAEEALIRKYKETVKIKANLYFMAGADEEDVVQEGMIGLFKAIRQYDTGKDASFGTFASVCITRQIITAIRYAGREKHKALNTYISLSNPVKEDEGDVTVGDTLRADMVENPEVMLVIKDVAYYILHNGDDIFSNFEMRVLNEALKGYDYQKIAEKLDKSVKSVDNAMQRTRKKIISYLWQ
ncbi:MAG: RNA polymerase sporulation sigma factor SigH [Clostridiales bacterium]|nr:RNA polymerase sporulation sigma factor SigH [Clostridiales bacterium]